MFEVNGAYENRIGQYTVLAINGPKMTVRYADGSEATLNVNIQFRIWENIVAEREATKSSSRKRKPRTAVIKSTAINHYIKVISIPPGEGLAFPGWEERVVMADIENDQQLGTGDRLIYFAKEAKTFFAVVTLTGDLFKANPKKYTFTIDAKTAEFSSVDIDDAAIKLENSVPLDAIELESLPNFGKQALTSEAFYAINEDDFELLAEALAEISEDEEDIIDDDFEEEEDE